jgi:hypothetical protein
MKNLAIGLALAGTLCASTVGVPAPALAAQGQHSNIAGAIPDLMHAAGFGDSAAGPWRPTQAVQALQLTPGLIVQLDDGAKRGLSDGQGTYINNVGTRGDQIVVRASATGTGFGVVTQKHEMLSLAFKTLRVPNSRVLPSADGGLQQVTASGQVIGYIRPAVAVDSLHQGMPANYAFDNATGTLRVNADTRNAVGLVFVDPSYKCIKAVASLVGWANAVGMAAWAASAIASGGITAVIGFFAWQGIAGWRTYGVIQNCR